MLSRSDSILLMLAAVIMAIAALGLMGFINPSVHTHAQPSFTVDCTHVGENDFDSFKTCRVDGHTCIVMYNTVHGTSSLSCDWSH